MVGCEAFLRAPSEEWKTPGETRGSQARANTTHHQAHLAEADRDLAHARVCPAAGHVQGASVVSQVKWCQLLPDERRVASPFLF
jgi:hypothetical protein